MRKKLQLLAFVLLTNLCFAQVFQTVALLQNGSNDKRINIAIMGDGFTSAQQTAFETAATNSSNYLLNKSPFAEYRNFFNVYAVKVISPETGVKHPGTATDVTEPVIPVSNPNNYFGSRFDTSNIHRLLYSTSTNLVTQVLAANVPDYDIGLVLCNSTEYGGAGGQFAFSSLNSSANEIVVHELGHSFANLADEYWYAPTGESPNKTQDSNPATNKWKNWLNFNGVGIHPFTEDPTWFRPHQSCEMRYLGQQFCSVCKERIIEKIHSIVSTIDSYTPANTSTLDGNSNLNFSVTEILPIPNTLVNSWTLNGTALSSTGTTLTVTPAQLNSGNNTLVFSVTDNTTLVRTDNHASLHVNTVAWNINKTALGTVEINANEKSFTVYPNPSSEKVFVRGKQDFSNNAEVQFFDASGRLIPIKLNRNSDQILEIDVSGLSTGNYLMRVSDNNEFLFSENLIIK